jgi:hypothetical protein
MEQAGSALEVADGPFSDAKIDLDDRPKEKSAGLPYGVGSIS